MPCRYDMELDARPTDSELYDDIKQYYVDFSTMIVNARSKDKAEQIAKDHLKRNQLSPDICNIEETENLDNFKIGILAEETFCVNNKGENQWK